jgi:hypothetical protein
MAKLTKEEAERLKNKKQEDLEKIKLEKERIKRRKKRHNSEQKRINTLVSFPLKILFNTAVLVGLISFIYLFFYIEIDLIKTIVNVFFIFTSIYLGGGVIAILYYYFMSEEKLRELNEKLRIETENRQNEEKRRQQMEAEELEAIERELLEKRLIKKDQTESSQKEQIVQPNLNIDSPNIITNIDNDQNLSDLKVTNENEQDFDESYYVELLGPEFSEKTKQYQ